MRRARLSVKLTGGFLMVGALVPDCRHHRPGSVSEHRSKASSKIAYAEGIEKQMLQREIDHLNWVRKAGMFLQDETLVSLGVETNEHNCAFGKWYYSDDRKRAETEIPEIRELLAKIEDPHTKLHKSAQAIETLLNKGRGFPAGSHRSLCSARRPASIYGTYRASSVR